MRTCSSLSFFHLPLRIFCLFVFVLSFGCFFWGGGVGWGGETGFLLYSPGCPGTHSVDQAGLELRNLPASASRVLGLKACTTTPSPLRIFFFKIYLFYVYEYTVAVQMVVVVSLHVVVGNLVSLLALVGPAHSGPKIYLLL